MIAVTRCAIRETLQWNPKSHSKIASDFQIPNKTKFAAQKKDKEHVNAIERMAVALSCGVVCIETHQKKNTRRSNGRLLSTKLTFIKTRFFHTSILLSAVLIFFFSISVGRLCWAAALRSRKLQLIQVIEFHYSYRAGRVWINDAEKKQSRECATTCG